MITTVTPASAASVLFAALPASASGTAYKFVVTTADNKYITDISTNKKIDAGYYYQTALSMTARYPLESLSSATVDDLGSVIGADGKIYLNKTAAEGASPATTAAAMIAYLGSSSDCTNGLAIQLNASPVSKNWADAKTYAEGLTPVAGGTWRLPSMADWQNMFAGCAVAGDATSVSGQSMDPIAGFKAKIAATGITWPSDYYWSSTPNGLYAWLVGVALNGANARAFFTTDDTSSEHSVLGCLAF